MLSASKHYLQLRFHHRKIEAVSRSRIVKVKTVDSQLPRKSSHAIAAWRRVQAEVAELQQKEMCSGIVVRHNFDCQEVGSQDLQNVGAVEEQRLFAGESSQST